MKANNERLIKTILTQYKQIGQLEIQMGKLFHDGGGIAFFDPCEFDPIKEIWYSLGETFYMPVTAEGFEAMDDPNYYCSDWLWDIDANLTQGEISVDDAYNAIMAEAKRVKGLRGESE